MVVGRWLMGDRGWLQLALMPGGFEGDVEDENEDEVEFGVKSGFGFEVETELLPQRWSLSTLASRIWGVERESTKILRTDGENDRSFVEHCGRNTDPAPKEQAATCMQRGPHPFGLALPERKEENPH